MRGEGDVDALVQSVRQSLENLGVANPNLPEFVRFLIGAKPVTVFYLTARYAPGSDASTLDMLILAGRALIGVTVFTASRVAWSASDVKQCLAVSMDTQGALAVGTVMLGNAISIRIADDLDKEGELNRFLTDVTAAAWGN